MHKQEASQSNPIHCSHWRHIFPKPQEFSHPRGKGHEMWTLSALQNKVHRKERCFWTDRRLCHPASITDSRDSCAVSWHQRGQVYTGLCDSTALWYQRFTSAGSHSASTGSWVFPSPLSRDSPAHIGRPNYFLKAYDLSWLDFRASSLKCFQPQGCTAAILLTGATWRKSG